MLLLQLQASLAITGGISASRAFETERSTGLMLVY